MATWPSANKPVTTTTDAASDSISGARADINKAITNQIEIIDMFNIPGSPTDNYILKYNASANRFDMEADASGGAVTAVTNMVDDRIMTASGATTLNAEANLVFNGSQLNLTGSMVLGGGSLFVDKLELNDDTLSSTDNVGDGNIILDPFGTGVVKINSGGLHMNSSKITNLTDPAAAQDAATKAYVDANAGSVTPTSTTTFTNKTIDANGTGNSITNLEVADLASGVLDTDLSSVSGSDDTLASAKAIKTYVDATATGITSVVQDTTPQLGGDLDVNGQSIVSVSNGNIVMDPNGTGAVTIEGDGTAPGSYADRLARLANPPLVIDNNQSNAWWGSQLIMKDNSDDIFAMVGREDTTNKVYGYIITMDPNGTHTNTSAYSGDYGYYFNMQYEGGTGSDEWYMIHNVYGADDGYFINSFGSGHNSYARTPLILNGSLTVGTTDVNLKGLKLTDSTGSVTVNDNMTVNLDSGGTTALVTENESATANGNRVTVGKSDTAHTSGVGFEVRRGTGSGFETQFKVETATSRTRTTVTSAFNLAPVAYASLHGAPSIGDLQFLTTDGAGASKNAPIYYDGSNWKYFNDNSTVAPS